jgi:hypothetical protein
MKTPVIILACALASALYGQTAANWTASDCSGNSHELFSDLNSGKIVVITWVMPCSQCINGALTAQTEVQTARTANPGKILFYLVDDYANTSCSSLAGWASANGVTEAIVISNSLVSMSDYGTAGMPKVVVFGGSDHKVYYNANDLNITANGIKNAIASAVAAATGIKESTPETLSYGIFPNPANNFSELKVNVPQSMKLKIDLSNSLGQKVSEIFNGTLSSGAHDFVFRTSHLPSGLYFMTLSDGDKTATGKLLISR